ncbi:outer membrane protein [Bartonella schoenbuchensis]|uniref:Porin n=1 Tax=Bartonella schoenbuchensis (strain DSM 13525 / NCTC 13165 / R1) TaxID=687861 RepID=E6YXY2_BARSR|nr:outer membrane protein [Bartonella schoenbuchensis]AQX30157.1 outer membrane immunogenic protein [Bartonella schoenbuchensis R1]CBI81720.1 Hemin-binding protein C [Bartonella schoenbuchensis R1]
MYMKYLITVSAFVLLAISTVQAENGTIPQESISVTPSVIVTPSFSWTGFYLGGQIGIFSNKIDLSSGYLKNDDVEKWALIRKDFMPKLSGVVGGFYAGANVSLGNSFIIGVDTDMVLSDKKDIKTVKINDYGQNEELRNENTARDSEGMVAASDCGIYNENIVSKIKFATYNHILKQKWAGATRVRVGFAADHVMPYVAGGISYTQLQDVLLRSSQEQGQIVDNTVGGTGTMIGYTLGAGVDFVMIGNTILRTEYRYSDFGKKQFAKSGVEHSYKTNDFRVGVAYKF